MLQTGGIVVTTQAVQLKPMAKKTARVSIVGTSPLIMQRWSEKAKESMLAKQMKKVVVREAKDPEAQYESSKYILPDVGKKPGGPGFPAGNFKECCVRGGKALGMVMTDSRGAFFIKGVYSPRDGRMLVPIKGEWSMREDPVRLESGVADLRYRAQLVDWSATLEIEYIETAISIEQIINALNAGGFGCGVGEWRPQHKGEFGRFEVVNG
jgi:hypothetical protein